jgi:hypothetical protein
LAALINTVFDGVGNLRVTQLNHLPKGLHVSVLLKTRRGQGKCRWEVLLRERCELSRNRGVNLSRNI